MGNQNTLVQNPTGKFELVEGIYSLMIFSPKGRLFAKFIPNEETEFGKEQVVELVEELNKNYKNLTRPFEGYAGV